MQTSDRKLTLTDWNQEPTVEQLKADLDFARSFHDAQMCKIEHWNSLIEARNLNPKMKKVEGRSTIQPKLVRRQAEWRYSALTEPFLGNSGKLFKVSPVTYEDTAAAKQNELVLNWQFRTKLNRVKFIDDYVRSAVDDGTAIVRLGWKRHTVMEKTESPEYSVMPAITEDEIAMVQQAVTMAEQDFEGFTANAPEDIQLSVQMTQESGQPMIAHLVGMAEIEVEKVIENRPTVEVLDPRTVFIDPSCNGNFQDALFVIHSFETNRAELLKEKRYSNLEFIDWDNVHTTDSLGKNAINSNAFTFADKARRKTVAYEYWGYYDIEGNGELKPIVATWVGNTLIRMELNPFPDKALPFVLVNYLPVKRELYGETDAELLEDNQKVLGALSRGVIDLLGRSANSQIGFAKGLLDPVNKRRYETGQDYEFNPNMPVEAGIIHHKYPELPQSAMLMLQLQNQEAEALTGVKSFSGGISGNAYGNVAAGIRGMLDAASKREMAILRRLAKGIIEIGQKVLAMNAVFLSEEETVRVTNTEFVTVKREDLAGQFDLDVDVSTAEVDDSKSQDLAFLLQTLGNSVGQDIVLCMLAEIADLKRMPALAEKLRNYEPPPPTEMQQKLQELEMKKLELELAQMDANIQLALAKTKHTISQAELIDLDYVEQETGTKHARDVEKQQSQAKANEKLEITKSMLRPRKADTTAPDIAAAIGYQGLNK